MTGRVDLTGLWFGVDAGDGALAAPPTRLMTARALPAGDRELVTAWFDRPLTTGRWSLSVGWRAETAHAVVVSLADTYRSADPAAADQTSADGFRSSRYAPLSWTLEVEVPVTTPAVVGWGDERLLSGTPGAELSDSPVSRAARAVDGVPVHVVYPGTGLALWQRHRSHWTDAALDGPAHEVFHAMGARDLVAGASPEELQHLFAESLDRAFLAWGREVTAVLLDEHAPESAEDRETARAFNRWLVESHPGPVARLHDGAFDRVRPALVHTGAGPMSRQAGA